MMLLYFRYDIFAGQKCPDHLATDEAARLAQSSRRLSTSPKDHVGPATHGVALGSIGGTRAEKALTAVLPSSWEVVAARCKTNSPRPVPGQDGGRNEMKPGERNARRGTD
ncbi:hypothetical protein NDU88_005994 [Pleurodeles waltl]|uniref:Uncharacterized protein n=1 Tax=Pleurodeles waltl TaxID=8319 RepID=A0AAV7VPK1_PLEWA|nr:hypothetical protein NDU88_005994 [Pleurodeles waltl]